MISGLIVGGSLIVAGIAWAVVAGIAWLVVRHRDRRSR